MPARSMQGGTTRVTVKFPDSLSWFLMSPGETVGDLASHLACLSERHGATPLTIDLTFSKAGQPAVH